ncbi:MAG: response regulator transcription factor [Chloroflexi bacterium]|nr:response regulator transcription factor [Chloroflexota bacterium]
MDRNTENRGTNESRPIRVLIADDHAVLRAGLRMLLDAEPDIEVVGEAGDGLEAIERTKRSSPDVVLLDVAMPRRGGLEVIQQIRDISPQTRVLILTMHDDEGYLREALTAGGSGYVLKRAADIELLTAIRTVYLGGTYLHAAHTRVLFESKTDQRGPQAAKETRPQLSPREKEVLRLIALGYTNQQAADMLYLSVKTVETYRRRLMTKLGLHNRAELVRYALHCGLLEEE